MHPPLVVVMGVSGCGKSTVGQALASALGVEFIEGDHFHPPRNVELMATGVALTDADREGWLRLLAQQIATARSEGRGLVLSASALKRAYRDLLRGPGGELRFVHLHGAREVLARRMAARTGHYMPATLLGSQLATLEPPGADENAVSFDVEVPAPLIVRDALAWMGAPSAQTTARL